MTRDPPIERFTSSSKMSDETFRHVVKLTTPYCEEHSEDSVFYRFGLLTAVSGNPDLINCGPLRFDRLKVFYDGQRWVLEAEAVGR